MLAVGTAMLCAWLGGCSKNGENGVDPSPTPGRFMFVQASPDAPPLDLYVDSTRVDSSIVYPRNTNYMNIDAGTRILRIVRPGTMQTLYLAQVPVVSGWNYTIIGVDSVANYYSMLLVDNLALPPAGKANLRFVQVSPNAPAVDLVIRNGITLFTNRGFKSKTDFIALDAGVYTFDVKVSGTPTLLASVSGDSLTAG